MQQAPGPSAGADWVSVPDAVNGAPAWMIVGADGVHTHVANEPVVEPRTDGDSDPLALTLILERQPPPGASTIVPYIRGGAFTLTADTVPSASDLAESALGATHAEPLFARRSQLWLLSNGDAIANATHEGPAGRVTLSSTLTEAQARAFLRALRGEASGLVLRCDLEYWATRPGSGSSIDGVVRTLRLSRTLEGAVAPIRDALPLSSWVTAVCPNPRGPGFQPVAQRTASQPDQTKSFAVMATLGGLSAAMPAALKTGPAVLHSAQFLAASDLVVRPPRLQHLWALNDLVIDLTGGTEEHYPQIDGDTPLWRDRISPDRWWYAPELVVVPPDPVVPFESSPFRFSFRPAGHDEQGRLGLEATIRVRLRPRMPDAANAAWQAQGEPHVEGVPRNGLSVALEIPYRDSSGHTQVQSVTASAVESSDGDVVATFQLTDQWARLAYGALAIPKFQEEPARLAVNYVFPAYVPTGDAAAEVAWGGKRAGPSIDGRDATRPAALAGHAPIRIPQSHVVASSGALAHVDPSLLAVFTPHVPTIYGVRTQGHTDRLELAVPCATFGAFYVQTDADGTTAQPVGCQDAYALGQVQLKLYERVTTSLDAETPPFTVYRSMQVPGRFLVLPKAYTVARFAAGDARAYRPALFMFSNIDAVHPDRTRCVVMATLQPAVSTYWRARLLDDLKLHQHPDPQLEWPTELSVTPDVTWAIASAGPAAGLITAVVAKTPDGFQISLATGIDGILQLKAILEHGGVTAAVQFPLADHTTLDSTLAVDLARIDGPLVGGPVEAALTKDGARLTNRLSQSIDVEELFCVPLSGAGVRLPVEARLGAGATRTFAVPLGTTTVQARSTVAEPASSLDEVRTFVEDIYLSVVFQASFDFTAAGLESLGIEARIAGVPGPLSARLTPAETGAEMSFLLPLTTYLAQPTLQFALTRTPIGGAGSTGAWHDWRLDTLGAVVELSSKLIQEG